MKALKTLFLYALPIVFIVAIAGGIIFFASGKSIDIPSVNPFNNPQETQRKLVQFSFNPDDVKQKTVNVEATKLPEFVYKLADKKFDKITNAASYQLRDLAQATIVHTAYANEHVDAEVSVNQEKHQLIVHPKDMPNFTPGKYKLSLKLRTIEGVVNIEQDFTWGVIAVNTNKSIYTPGDVATIGMGVLNDKGETQCKTGKDSAKVWMSVTDPSGKIKEYSTEDGSIKDSGECAPISVTNQPDFVAIYLINGPGIYQMKVIAEVNGEKRAIEDYFKVEASPAFDVERSSFPTRIYPKAPYKGTFTVTAQDDYSGTVEEIVPSNFTISQISNNGRETKDGEFKKIIWDVNLQKGKTVTFTYVINFPHVSPEFYLLGPIKIGTFEEARQWQIASDALNTTSGVVAYEDNNSQTTWARTWSGSAYNTEGQMATGTGTNAPTDSRWFREVSSPKTGEKLVAIIDNVTGGDRIFVYRWTGTAWNSSADLNFALANATSETTRLMDIAYEELSGDALFVYSDGANAQLRYYYYTSSSHTWSSVQNAGTAIATFKRWVKLKPQQDSDTILVGYLNNSSRVGAMIWDGASNTFGDQIDDSIGTATGTNAQEAFDIAWETQSGVPMIMWGSTGGSGNNIMYRRFVSNSWTSEAETSLTDFTNGVAWLVASANPSSSSNEIAIGTVELTAQNCRFIIWNGSTWTQGSTVTCRANIVQREIGVVWEYNNNNAMWVYVTNANQAQITYRTYTGGVFGASTTVATAASGNILSIQAYSDSLSLGTIVLCAVDAAPNAQLDSREWDGGNWSSSFTRLDTHATGIQGDTESSEAYGFGFDRNLETLAAYRWFNNPGPVTTDVGTPLTTQDTPYTLTTANQAFRLRLLLYTPDTLTTSLRNYKLQYVDPGTGSCAAPTGGTPSIWTDVPSSGGQISFNPLAPADGANLTSNANDPTYQSKVKVTQTYKETNPFTNSTGQIDGDKVGEWDFSLIDNTTFDRTAQSFCFRVARSNDLVLQIDKYPQINTAALSDVRIQGGTRIQGGAKLQ